MRRVAWLVLIGAACVGCAKKPEPALPDVTLDAGGPRVAFPPAAAQAPTFELAYGKMWDPKAAEQADPMAKVKSFVAKQHFVTHQTEHLAPATVGSFVSLAQGGMHGVAVPAALAAVYPDAAQTFEAEIKKGLKIEVTNVGVAVLDVSSSTETTAKRVLVYRVPGGTDDELRMRFGEYMARVENAVKATGTTITGRQRGGLRITGSLSDIRHDSMSASGFVRSVVVRGYDDADIEFGAMIMGDGGATDNVDFFKLKMKAESGPFLVVALRNVRR